MFDESAATRHWLEAKIERSTGCPQVGLDAVGIDPPLPPGGGVDVCGGPRRPQFAHHQDAPFECDAVDEAVRVCRESLKDDEEDVA